MRRSIASVLFAALVVSAQAQAALRDFTAHVRGNGDFNLAYFGFDIHAAGVPFDIYINTVVDDDGVGQLAEQPAELTITLLAGGIGNRVKRSGTVLATYDTGTFEGVPTSFLTYALYVDQTAGGFGDTLRISHTILLDGDPLGGSLATPLPWSPADGWIDYTITHYTELGGFTIGTAYGTIDHASFSLSPVPEPAQYALLLAGLALTGYAAGRRRGA